MKYIFLDIDGTILSHKNGVSDKTKYAIKKLRQQGHKVLLCSGRHISIIDSEILQLEYDGFVLANGAFVYYQGEYILNETFAREVVKKIVDLSKKNDFLFYLEAINAVYTNSLKDERHIKFISEWKLPNNFSDSINWDDGINIAMLFLKDNSHFEIVEEHLSQDVVLAKHFNYPSCDVNIKGINKAYGIKKLIKHLKIDIKNTLAFGDGLNDLEMIEFVGTGIAMGNACDELKKLADEITTSVDEDGVYNYLVKKSYIEEFKEN